MIAPVEPRVMSDKQVEDLGLLNNFHPGHTVERLALRLACNQMYPGDPSAQIDAEKKFLRDALKLQPSDPSLSTGDSTVSTSGPTSDPTGQVSRSGSEYNSAAKPINLVDSQRPKATQVPVAEPPGPSINHPTKSSCATRLQTPSGPAGATRLQQPVAHLIHVRSNTLLELPTHLSVIHIGKPNHRVPPDVDVAGFEDSKIVSRIHAMIEVEFDSFNLMDVGSSNGTYVNSRPLTPGDRYRLRSGDRISLGREDTVSFIFQAS